MALLDAPTLAGLLNRPAVADPAQYPPSYIAALIADAAAAIAGYLGYDPVLQAVAGEEGAVSYVQAGPYAGRYVFATRVAPLVPGPAAGIFSALALAYGLASLPPGAVDPASATVLHRTGQVFCLAPGAVEALTWQYGLSPGVRAVTYIASYVAGYATGIGDPTPPGGGSYGAAPMPAGIVQAAALLIRERLTLDDAANASPTTLHAGGLTLVRSADQEQRFQPTAQGTAAIGAGTPLAAAAARRLAPYRRPVLPLLI